MYSAESTPTDYHFRATSKPENRGIPSKFAVKPDKTGKNRKKPVETKENALTKFAEKPKVNCGTVSPHPHEHWRFAARGRFAAGFTEWADDLLQKNTNARRSNTWQRD